MERKLKVNTHKAYLNTEIVITNSGDKVNLVDLTTGESYGLGKRLKIHLSAGHHQFACVEFDEKFCVDVEDAIKLGGGNIKKGASFVSDDTPWILVTMDDRMYGYNTQTKEEFVEYSLTPDKIEWLCDDYFLFKTQEDYTIFFMQHREVVFYFQNLVYSNTSYVVYNDVDEGVFKIYNYKKNRFCLSIEGQYSIVKNNNGDDLIFYIIDNYVHCYNFVTGEDLVINEIYGNGTWFIHANLNISKDAYCLFDRWLIINNHFMDLIEKKICGSIILPSNCRIVKILNNTLENNYEEQAELFRKEACDIFDKYNVVSHKIQLAYIEDVIDNDGSIEVWYYINTISIHKGYCNNNKQYYIATLGENKNNEKEINRNDFYNNRPATHTEQETFSIDKEEGILLAFSESKNIYITKCDGEIHFHENGNCQTILEELFDTSKFKNAYFTSDGKNIVLNDNDGKLVSFGLESFLTESFDIEGVTSFKKDAYNGYKPEIHINNTSSIYPVWRDPISLASINPKEISGLEYVSPDKLWYAKSKMDIVYYNRMTGKEMTYEEYSILYDKYDFKWNSTEKENSVIIEKRKRLYESNKSVIESLLRESNMKFYKSDKEKFEEFIHQTIKRYIQYEKSFTPLFVEKRNYLIYCNRYDNKNHRILIGRNAWFLNYVSFSFDSRYIAFGAKMQSDEFRYTEEGVFEIYDLVENKIVLRMDNEEQLYAVWVTIFSKMGDVAFYDSHANAYVVKAATNYKEPEEISGKSLLCFSPSGKYIAFSDQRYISYTYNQMGLGGHQPSGNIYIHSVDSLQSELAYFNDFGEGLKGASVSSQARSVAAAAFSQDENQLLAVGDDGVVVVRNLHLGEWIHTDKEGDVWTHQEHKCNW